MFEKAIEQIKRWANEPRDWKRTGVNLPGFILVLWCVLLLFTDAFGFDPTYTSNLPKVFAIIILFLLAKNEYEKENTIA